MQVKGHGNVKTAFTSKRSFSFLSGNSSVCTRQLLIISSNVNIIVTAKETETFLGLTHPLLLEGCVMGKNIKGAGLGEERRHKSTGCREATG